MLDAKKLIINVIFSIFIFPFSPSMSNKLVMYGHTLCFLETIHSEFFFTKLRKITCLSWKIQEIDNIYLMGIFVVTTSVNPLVNLMFS
jgi:hypothetical protein